MQDIFSMFFFTSIHFEEWTKHGWNYGVKVWKAISLGKKIPVLPKTAYIMSDTHILLAPTKQYHAIWMWVRVWLLHVCFDWEKQETPQVREAETINTVPLLFMDIIFPTICEEAQTPIKKLNLLPIFNTLQYQLVQNNLDGSEIRNNHRGWC